MRMFETLLLLSPELSGETRDTLLTTLIGVISREQGTLVTADHWGMKELAYPVQKHMRGYYVRLEYKAPPTCIAELERIIRISDGIYKFMTVKLADEIIEEVITNEVAGEVVA